MTTSPLERLASEGNTLIAEPAGGREFAGLRRAGPARLKDAGNLTNSLPHTLGLGPEVWRVLAKGHEIRNRAEYEGELDVDARLLADILAAYRAVDAKLDALAPLA